MSAFTDLTLEGRFKFYVSRRKVKPLELLGDSDFIAQAGGEHIKTFSRARRGRIVLGLPPQIFVTGP
ncbi:hypothetical protein EYF80_031041 [Liparis tanakae]|uniref:Uncharacterized protein n=1 Tax=Liparis tanakae TaxID=230148 RepID=A0A4Z2GYW3_9TELE|nr:hypothetical protein EYF80_031041 [Liparis tanakae]